VALVALVILVALVALRLVIRSCICLRSPGLACPAAILF